MSQSPVATLREYSDSLEAETIRIRLAAAGIQAFVTGTDAATALGLGGAATLKQVQIKVPHQDLQRARAILEEDELRIQSVGPWICGRCHQQNEPAFEVCWSCDKPRSDDDERGRLGETSETDTFGELTSTAAAVMDDDDSNPYRPVLIDRSLQADRSANAEPDELRESVSRCFRAAIVGVIVLPPLVSFYAVYLLLRLDTTAYRWRSARRRLLMAWGINGVNIPLWILFWLQSA